MKMNLKVTSLILALFMTIGAFSGCSPSNTQQNETGGQPAESAVASEGAASTAPSGGERVSVKIGQQADVTSLDPHDQNEMSTQQVIRHMYERLINFAPDETLVPELATSWEIEDDQTVVIHLREGVTFHNGDPFTSADVKFSLERQKTMPKQQLGVPTLDHVEIVDDYTCKIKLTEPSAMYMINLLTYPGASMLSKNHVEALENEGKSLSDDPVGTGPYKFVSFKAADKTVIEKYDGYWGTPAKNDELVFVVIPDASARTIALETGDLDILIHVAPVDISRLDAAENIIIEQYVSASQEFIAPNNQKSPFDNILVRKAIAHLIDRDAVIAVAAEGRGTPLYTGIAQGAGAYYEDVVHYEYSIEKAKELLAEAGYADGFTTSMVLNGDSRLSVATYLQSVFAEAGITLNVEAMDSSALNESTARGDHELLLFSQTSSGIEPGRSFSGLYASSAINISNRFFYSSEIVDEAMKQAEQESDPDKRYDLYAKIQSQAIEDCAIIPLYTVAGTIGMNSKVEGVIAYPSGGHVYSQVTFK